MKSQWIGFHSTLGTGLQAFLDHKRALGCRFRTEEMTLRLFDRFLVEQHVTTIDAISPALMDTFLASRKRTSPQSYNHLLQTLARAFKWLAACGLAPPSPLRARPRRATRTRIPFLFDLAAARKLLAVAGSLPECPSTPLRAQTYRTIFALLYALGFRVGEVAVGSDTRASRRPIAMRRSPCA
jgi:site-specific recombinase XerD